MKRIRDVREKFYLEKGEAEMIKKVISLQELSFHLQMSYQHLWRKMTKSPKFYLERLEVEKIQELTGIDFKVH
jgi:hypothetical protein